MKVSDVLPRPRADLAEFEPYRTQQMAAHVRVHANEWSDPNPARDHLATASPEATQRYPEMLVLVDEAYSDFAGNTIVPAMAAHPNIVVTKTFSKARAAAGLRLGVLIADPRVAGVLRAVQLPYNVSPLTTVIAGRIVQREGDVRRRIAQCATERDRVYDALRRAPRVEAFPSVTNFILFRLAELKPAE